MNQIVKAKGLVKSYGEGAHKRNVVDNVSAEIGEGEFVAVMGPSGSGKSTLLFVLSGMDAVDSGEAFFEERSLASYSESELADLRRTQMGFVFQQPTLLKNLNILDNIILPSMRDNHKNAVKIVQRARGLMRQMGIEELDKRGITQVSGGQLQRAGICRAMMNSPKIIFGDEPTGALNSQAAQGVMDILARIHEQGTAIMLVTHDANVAIRAERVLYMRDGKIVNQMHLGKCCDVHMDTIMEERRAAVMGRMREIGI